MPQIPFIDLARHVAAIRGEIDAAIARVLDAGWFILGPEVEAFEREFAAALGAPHAVGVSSGTDAITLALRALGIGPGDEVITSPISATYSALAISAVGAVPVFADVHPETLLLDPDAAAAAVTPRTAAIFPVHLYGTPADLDRLGAAAARHGLALIEDCCQAHGAAFRGTPVGMAGAAGAFSFYPTKNLGAAGDGGAVVCRDAALAERVRRLRNGGQTDRYHHAERGTNARLDELQAAILRAKLPHLACWNERRHELATRYRRAFAGAPLRLPLAPEGARSVYHLFVLRVHDREHFQALLRSEGIGTLVHYPIPIYRQPAYADLDAAPCPEAERACLELVSLPLYPELRDEEAAAVVDAVMRCATTQAS